MKALIIALVLLAGQAQAVERDSDGRIKRSSAVLAEFKRQYPCPSTGKPYGPCPGYVIDHVYPLACGGLDDPINLQWQTVKDGKRKDRWERKGCQIKRRP